MTVWMLGCDCLPVGVHGNDHMTVGLCACE